MPVLDELAAYLQAEGVGTPGVTLFKGGIPLDDLPLPAVPIIGLVPVPGLAPVRAQDGTKFEQPVVQVVVRGEPHALQAALETAQDAWDALDGVSNTLLSGVPYLWIFALQSPFFLRHDAYERPLVVFSVRCARGL